MTARWLWYTIGNSVSFRTFDSDGVGSRLHNSAQHLALFFFQCDSPIFMAKNAAIQAMRIERDDTEYWIPEKNMNLLPRWICIDFFFSLQLQNHQHYPIRFVGVFMNKFPYFKSYRRAACSLTNGLRILNLNGCATETDTFEYVFGEYVRNGKQYGTTAFTIFPVTVNESCIVAVNHVCLHRLLRESGVVLMMVSLLFWFYQCFVFYSTQTHAHKHRFPQWKCPCDVNSWKNSNRCQTNSTLFCGCALWWNSVIMSE